MINHATIIGRTHRLMHLNCHDFAISGVANAASKTPISYGIVFDGCGSKHQDKQGFVTPSHNEVGAKLLGEFAGIYLQQNLCQDEDFMPAFATASHHFLDKLQNLFPFPDHTHRTRFLATHLLTTIVGFVCQATTTTIFWAGDGYFCLNGDIATLDSDNHPDYLAYQLFNPTPDFKLQAITLPTASVDWVAVATDGWKPDQLLALAVPKPTFGLQRWLNQQANVRGYFEDDGAVAVYHRSEKTNTH